MPNLKKIAYESLASQGYDEMHWLLKRVSKIKPKVILEIGVDKGYSMKAWWDAFDPEVLLGVDNNPGAIVVPGLMVYAMDSQEASTYNLIKSDLMGQPVDFLFLDGDHHYEAVKKDYELYSSLVRSGGMIAFHDAVPTPIEGVEIDRLMAELPVEIYHTDGTGVGLLVKP